MREVRVAWAVTGRGPETDVGPASALCWSSGSNSQTVTHHHTSLLWGRAPWYGGAKVKPPAWRQGGKAWQRRRQQKLVLFLPRLCQSWGDHSARVWPSREHCKRCN